MYVCMYNIVRGYLAILLLNKYINIEYILIHTGKQSCGC